MGRSGRRPERLAVLAQGLGVTEDYPGLHLAKLNAPSATPEDANIAEAFLDRARLARFESKSHIFQRKPSRGTYNAKEATKTLEDLVASGCSPGQASHLIKIGADVNYSRHKSANMVKRVRGKDQEDVRSSLFTTAVDRGTNELINVLAEHADQANLDEALGMAIAKRNIGAIKTLIVAGADPNHYEAQIRNLVRNSDVEVVCTLCSGSKALSAEIATRSLFDAVMSSELKILRMLLWCDADADTQNPSALFSAIQAQRLDLVAALCLGKRPPSPDHLARGVATVCADLQTPDPEALTMVEILLSAGAKGNDVAQTIIVATKRGLRLLVEKLVEYSDFDAERSPQAIKSAMSNGDLPLFHSLIGMSLIPSVVDDLLSFTPTTRQSVSYQDRLAIVEALLKNHRPSPRAASRAVFDASKHHELEIIDILFQAGAKGDDISEALNFAFKQHGPVSPRYELIEALIRGGADVNTHEGACVLAAATSNDIAALNLLLQGEPTIGNLNNAFSACIPIERTEGRYNVLRMLITAGARGQPIDKALIDVIDQAPETARFRQLLLDDGKADINFQDGECIIKVVKSESTGLLRTLLKYTPARITLDNALVQAMQLNDRQKRLSICHLITHTEPGVSRNMIDQALVNGVRMKNRDSDLVGLLLDKGASIDYDLGAALQIVIVRGDNKLLARLLMQKSEAATLIRMLNHALEIDDEERKFSACQLLLTTSNVLDGDSLGPMLHRTFDANQEKLRLLELFLSKDASANNSAIEAFNKAIVKDNKAALQLLVNAARNTSILRHAFSYAWTKRNADLETLQICVSNDLCRNAVDLSHYLMLAVETSPISRPLIEFLLEWNASVEYSDCKCLVDTASGMENEILALLLEHVKSRSAVTAVFEATMKHPRIWTEPEGSETVRLLLEKGAFGEILDQNLLFCVQRFDSLKNAPEILAHLISHGASSEYQNGLSIEVAARAGNLQVVETLLTANPSAKSLVNAFPYLLTASREEETVLKLIETFMARAGANIDLNIAHKELKPTVFLCMERFPRQTAVLSELIRHGASIEQKSNIVVVESIGPEAVSPLLWALHMLPTSEGDAIPEKLIEHGADLTFTTSKSKYNPLLAAVVRSRLSIVKLLLDRSVNASTMNYAHFSPLHLASREENLEIMRALIKAGAMTNDGSLHGAVIKRKMRAVELLIDSGHDPNFPSPFHDARNPMELIIRHPSMGQEPAVLIDMVRTLTGKGASKTYRNQEKSLLVLALDMPHAVLLTPSLLNAFMGELVNEPFNQYRNNGFVYSPYSYLVHNQQDSDPSLKPALLRILASYGCAPVYYREHGPQPDDYVGAPIEIDQAERTRREEERIAEEARKAREQRLAEEEQDHAATLRRQQEAQLERARIAKLDHEMTIAQESERSAVALQLARAEHEQREAIDAARRRDEFSHTESLGRLRIENAREETRLQLEYKERAALQEQAIIDARTNSERKLLEWGQQTRREEEDAAERAHRRNLLEIEAKKEGTVEQGRLLDKQQKLIEFQAETAKRLQLHAAKDDYEPD